jgi:hydroxymethylbilane synthase
VGSQDILRIGTRGSLLALWQARTVAARIAESGGPACEIVIIKTSGDRLQDAPLSEVGGKRLFVKEIEDALLSGDVDLAVHSSKDLPALLPDGLVIAGTLPREDPLDAVVLPEGLKAQGSGLRGPSLDDLIAALGQTPSIGTGSVRRIAQLTRLFPRARFTPIRGNLDTRLRKLDAGEHDALVLAAAGLRRLGFGARISLLLPASACVPAPGQGIVAVETRDEPGARDVVRTIDDGDAHTALRAERAVVDALGGGCQMPLGALATIAGGGEIEIVATVIALDGSRAIRASARGPRDRAAAVGASAGADLIRQGASEILGTLGG